MQVAALRTVLPTPPRTDSMNGAMDTDHEQVTCNLQLNLDPALCYMSFVVCKVVHFGKPRWACRMIC